MSKTLEDYVKELQFKKKWTVEQVAKSIGYSRVHLTKEMKKGDNADLKRLLLDKHSDTLQNVSESIAVSGELNKIVGEMQERLLRAEAHIEVYESAIAGLQSDGKDYSKRVSDLREQVRSAVNRRLDELRKKQQ